MEDITLVRFKDTGNLGVLELKSKPYRTGSSLNVVYLESGHYRACGDDEYELVENCESQAISNIEEMKEDSSKEIH